MLTKWLTCAAQRDGEAMSVRGVPLRVASFSSTTPLTSSRPSPFLFDNRIVCLPRQPIAFNASARSPCRWAWQRPVYVYPEPIPAFAKAETRKFKGELRKKLVKSKEDVGGDLDAVVEICAEIFSDFLRKEYGGPGTLLVDPFTDMLLALKEKKIRGAPVAARLALLWAQNFVDQDWEIWNSTPSVTVSSIIY